MATKQSSPAKLEALRRNGTLNPKANAVTHELFQDSDFFDARDLVQVKYEMLRRVEVEKDSVKQTAPAFGFSRPSFYQALCAFAQSGMAGLIPQKRGPRQAHKLTAEVLEFIEQCRAEESSRRSEELAQRVQKRFGVQVHPRTIERALARRQKKRR
ncbi:helix-turn-helix domain-containing protein [Acidobacteria bacterium AH-259-G07]|nr:helix-turn-helix domain-containing protein [Acidobacteria bacterium AH-259-G07]